jgi:hypothetical protein
MTQRVYHRDVLISHDAVSAIAWDDHLRNGLAVGACPRCQRPLKPGQPYEVGRRMWYPADCSSTSCTYRTTGHGPRPPKKST